MKHKYIPSLSVFFLAYNDENTIGELVSSTAILLNDLKLDYEIIVGNDASTDSTLQVLQDLQIIVPRLKIINHLENQGYGGNLISGLSLASKKFVFYTDGDGQYDPLELILLLEKVNDSVDVVNGYKKRRSDNWIRKILGNIYAYATSRLFNLPVRDTDCDFRLIRTTLLKKIRLTSKSGAICPELIIKLNKAGARFEEVPVSHYPRIYGHSQFMTIIRIWQTLIDDYRLLEMYYAKLFRRTRYLLVGSLSFVLQIIIFNILLLSSMKLHPAIAALVSDEIAIVYSYFLNNAITFRDRKHPVNYQMAHGLKNYLFIYLAASIIQTGTVFLGTLVWGQQHFVLNILFILGIALGIVWNYQLHNKFVWPRLANKTTPMTPEEFDKIYKLEGKHWWYVGTRMIAFTVLKKFIELKNITICDVGCGTGGNMEYMKDFGEVEGIDINDYAIKYAKGRGLKCQVGDMTKFEFPIQKYDLVTMFDVLTETPPAQQVKVLKNINQALKPNGHLMLREPAFKIASGKHDYAVNIHTRFSKNQMRDVLEQTGFDIKYNQYSNSLLFFPIVIKRKIDLFMGGDVRSDVLERGIVMNTTLKTILQLECALTKKGINFPFGVSLVTVAQKRSESDNQ